MGQEREPNTAPSVGKHALLHFAHHPEHLCRIGPEILRELVLDGLADLHEAALVDVFDAP